MEEDITEVYCQWSHIAIKRPEVQFITDNDFWLQHQRANTVVFPLYQTWGKSFSMQELSFADYCRMVRNWCAETFEYVPVLSKIEQGPFLLAFRLEFAEFSDAILCKLRWR